MKRIIFALLSMMGVGALLALAAVFYVIFTFSKDLPGHSQLATYEPPISTRVHAGDGRLIKEFATEKRVFVPIDAIPKRVTQAFLSAEDRNFYSHPGIDFVGIGRAVATNLQNLGQGRRLVGGSTITQQVAKNFLLGNEVSYKRKIREAIIAFRIEKAYSKDQILELYLNEIYLGKGRYGAAAAAMGYFNKALDELTLAEMAYLATLPKAPNNYQVEDHYTAALGRRNWIINRMHEDGHITKEEQKIALAEPLKVVKQQNIDNVDGRYFNEDIRRAISAKYGENALYEGGLSVRSTLDPYYQEIAAAALRAGLIRYDRRHGYRGPLKNIAPLSDWVVQLSAVSKPAGARHWQTAVVLETRPKEAIIGLKDGTKEAIALSELTWARKVLANNNLGPAISKPENALAIGDVILVEKLKNEGYGLRQIPKVQGGIVVIDPHTGRVLAMQGGYDYDLSEFNRATQAQRQPGSSFKPFVYLSALNQGFTPSTLVLDGPVEFSMGPGKGMWRPKNYEHDYLGLIPLRRGLELSRNTMTVRLADRIGMKNVSETARKFHVFDNMPPYLAMSLGSGDTTLMRMVTGYAIIVNGGKDIVPTLVDRIQDRHGKTIYRHDTRKCDNCGERINWQSQGVPMLKDTREQVSDPRTAYQLTSIMEGVVHRGTGRGIADIGRPVAAKTGTTNDYKDAWFISFTPDLVVGAYVGFDEPRNLGRHETGAKAALPIVRAFYKVALKGEPPTPFRIPENVSMVRVNPKTGRRTDPTDPQAIWEAFLPGTEPGDDLYILNQSGLQNEYIDPNSYSPNPNTYYQDISPNQAPGRSVSPADSAPNVGTGGLY